MSTTWFCAVGGVQEVLGLAPVAQIWATFVSLHSQFFKPAVSEKTYETALTSESHESVFISLVLASARCFVERNFYHTLFQKDCGHLEYQDAYKIK